MKEGIEDRIATKVTARSQSIGEKRNRDLKNVKPAFVEPLDPMDEIYQWDNWPMEGKLAYTQEFGTEAYFKLEDHINKLKGRYPNARW